ncbi:succinate--CoA ligase subunit alpha [Albidovulum sp.]|uniref:succinate--CoA ligase subunit alpha n=1 Tax=Albidovulum sp. TaxID=1872424 RepID=UPI0039B8E797
MSILLDETTRILFYGLETPHGQRQYPAMANSGARLVGAVADHERAGPGIRCFASAGRAVEQTGRIDLAIIFSPPDRVLAQALEAFDAGIRTVVCPTEYVPVHDALRMKHRADATGSILVGPNSSGILTPGEARAGFICNDICTPGRIGVVAKSGSVAFAAMSEMKAAGIGVSSVVSVGGDLVKGADYCTLLPLFEQDPETDAMLLLGEIGGAEEELAADFIARNIRKPVVAFVSGKTVRPGQNIGHAGAIVTRGRGGYQGKIDAFRQSGVLVAEEFSEIVPALRKALGAGHA